MLPPSQITFFSSALVYIANSLILSNPPVNSVAFNYGISLKYNRIELSFITLWLHAEARSLTPWSHASPDQPSTGSTGGDRTTSALSQPMQHGSQHLMEDYAQCHLALTLPGCFVARLRPTACFHSHVAYRLKRVQKVKLYSRQWNQGNILDRVTNILEGGSCPAQSPPARIQPATFVCSFISSSIPITAIKVGSNPESALYWRFQSSLSRRGSSAT